MLKRQILTPSRRMIVCAEVNTRLNSFSSTISQQNTHFYMYVETSKQQQSSPCKNSHLNCFKTTNFDRFHHKYINQYVIYRCERGRVGNVLNPLCFHLGQNYYSACRRRGGVFKCPRFWFFFRCRKLGCRSWAIPLYRIPIAI